MVTGTVDRSQEPALSTWPPHRRSNLGFAYELVGKPSHSGRAECAQVVPVRADSRYTLTARVKGGLVFLGSDYGTTFAEPTRYGVTLTHTFVTGPTTDRVRIYVHGWYNAGTYHADGVELAGPPSDSRIPEAPQQVQVVESTSSTALLHWAPSPGATFYQVLHNGVPVGTTTDPWTAVSGLTAGQEHRLTVVAANPAGASQPTGTELLTRPASVPPSAPRITVHDRQNLWTVLNFYSPEASDGYLVYVDGVPVGWSYSTQSEVPMTPGTHTVDVVAFNSAGASPRSSLTVTVRRP